MSEVRPNVIFVDGAPGSGKGTQCERIAKDYGYVHLSIGDLLREEAQKPNSAIGKELNDQMKNGSLASTELICKLLGEALKDKDHHNFLIDGFPRNMENVEGWKKTMKDQVNMQCVLVFDCDEKTSISRCLERGKSSGRADDNEESLKKRIATFNEFTRPAIELYEKENLVKRIDASAGVDKVYDDVRIAMKDFQQLH